MQCEIILIGNELLIGKIQDTNGLWIIQQLVPLGIHITRITTIEDNLAIISQTIHEAIQRKPNYIFTSGGLGPTFDDMTLEGVARGLMPPRITAENDIALEMVRQSYERRFKNVQGKDPSLTPARRKMAQIPTDAIPLSNREGSAPGVLISVNETEVETKIICLPGIPGELKAIFLDNVLPAIEKSAKLDHFYQCGFVFQDLGESKFTELVYQIKDQYPEIWIKTHPRKRETFEVELHLTSFSKKLDIPSQMKELCEKLRDHVIKSNGKIIEENPLKL
jgi:molybdenum cofactor synthesis domain-containing protein